MPGTEVTGFFGWGAALASLVLLLIVLELVRQRRLFERYAILWLLSALVLMGLASWRGALDFLSVQVLGIAYPPTAVFIIALGFVLMLLLHFSVAVSRLSDQSKVLAQRLALLEERLRHAGVQVEGDRQLEPAWPRPAVAEPGAEVEGAGRPEPVVAHSAFRRPNH